jgi:hypothetical protein
MAFLMDDVCSGGQFMVGEGQPVALGIGPNKIRGSAFIEGPVQFGNDKTFHPGEFSFLNPPIPKPEAVVMIGPLKNTDSPIPLICDPLEFIPEWEVSPCGVRGVGAEKYEEKLANDGGELYPYSLVVRAGDHTTQKKECGVGTTEIVTVPSEAAAIFIGDVDIYGYTRVKDRLSVVEKADFNDDVVVRQDVIVGSDIVSRGDITSEGDVVAFCGVHKLSIKKDFDIPHPTKEGWRLTHACVEGPEAAVYIRGRVTNKTEIELPLYWKDLVDIQSVTVNLTPIGAHQDVIVKRWDEKKIYLQAKGGMSIDCFYYIMAERKDTEKLIPEYQGNIENYPGDNSQRSIAGYHYDVKENN